MSIFLQTLNGLVFTCNLVTNRKVIKCANIRVITIKFHSLITPFLHFCLPINNRYVYWNYRSRCVTKMHVLTVGICVLLFIVVSGGAVSCVLVWSV